jgi:hypothetical protein
MFDDEAARRALQTLTDEPEPPVATSFDEVLRRGRRRVFMQRAGAVAGVVAVVAAIGVGTLLLRPDDQAGDGMRVADTPTSESSETSKPRETESPSTTVTTEAPVPGWTTVALPADITRSGQSCQRDDVELPMPPAVSLAARSIVESALVGAVEHGVGTEPTMIGGNWQETSQKHDEPRGYLTVEVGMDNGNGQIQLEAGRYGGTPQEMADVDVVAYGYCDSPLRRVLDDGTVLQLYSVIGSKEAPVQYVRIYRPDGRFYFIAAAGYSEADMVSVADSTARTVRGGRGKLPVTREQLVEIAERFVVRLG